MRSKFQINVLSLKNSLLWCHRAFHLSISHLSEDVTKISGSLNSLPANPEWELHLFRTEPWQPDESPPYHNGGVCAFLVPGVILAARAPVRVSHAKLVPGDTKGPSVASWAIETWSSQSLWAQKPHPFLFLRGNQSEDSWFKVKAITACLSGACVAAQYEIKAGLKCESCKEWKYGAGNRQNSPTLLFIKLLMHLINSAICGKSLSDKWARSNPTPDYSGTAEL